MNECRNGMLLLYDKTRSGGPELASLLCIIPNFIFLHIHIFPSSVPTGVTSVRNYIILNGASVMYTARVTETAFSLLRSKPVTPAKSTYAR